jgi:hypothetical protein
MLWKLLVAFALMATCVVIHAASVTSALRWVRAHASVRTADQYWPRIWLFIRVAAWIIVFHLLEIAVWATCYWSSGAMPDLPSSVYFSTVTYTTTGYGDLVLPAEWRLVGGVEALTGILMCGWSTGFFFAIVTRLEQARTSAAGSST